MAAAALLSTATACTSAAKDKTTSGQAGTTAASTATPKSGSPATGSPTASSGSTSASHKPKQADSKSGGINKIVPPQRRATKRPVPLTGTANFGGGVTARLVDVKAVHGSANGPGEVAGPALRVDVRLNNDTGRTIDLSQAVVTIYDAAATPGVQLTQSGSAPFHGSARAHSSVRATYVFTLPTAHRDPVTVNFSYTSSAPVVLFVGNAK
jgi:hypothetical protein